MEARLEQEVDGLRGAIGGCQLDSSSEPVQISRGLIDVQEGLTERGVFLVSELHVAELHDVAASDPHGLRGHSLGNIDHRGDRRVLPFGAVRHRCSCCTGGSARFL